jgi:hypothetical protein
MEKGQARVEAEIATLIVKTSAECKIGAGIMPSMGIFRTPSSIYVKSYCWIRDSECYLISASQEKNERITYIQN